jgi:uncharacterized phage protein (TIGR01671 family)
MRTIKFRVWDSISKKMYKWEEIKHIPLIEFDKEHYTLMQFIGIKTSDNIEVYESDIVKLTNTGYGFNVGLVEYLNHGNPCFQAIQTKEDFPATFHLQVKSREISVIGNEFQNPELL